MNEILETKFIGLLSQFIELCCFARTLYYRVYSCELSKHSLCMKVYSLALWLGLMIHDFKCYNYIEVSNGEHSYAIINTCFHCSALLYLVSLLRDLRHNNIVTLHDIVHTDKSLTLVFEYLVS